MSKFYQVLDITNPVHVDDGLYKQRQTNAYVYSKRSMAVDNAKTMAAKNPGTQYAVMQIDTVFEAAIPKILEKQFNADGELLNV